MKARRFTVLIASPGDVSEERQRAKRACETLHREFSQRERDPAEVQAMMWEEFSRPAAGRPQQQIFEQLGRWDLVVAIFWARTGTPTGHDDNGMEIARSGSIEEVRTSLRRHNKSLLLYRCTRAFFRSSREDRVQFERVCDFFDEVDRDKLALVQHYENPDEFEQRLVKHLRETLLDQLKRGDTPDTENVQGLDRPDPPHPLPPGIAFPREDEVTRMFAALDSPCRMAVLTGDSGSGKSTLASTYFREFNRGKKRWISCRGKLLKSAGHIPLQDCDLVVLDGFEDRDFCSTAAALVPAGALLIVTTADPQACAVACRIRLAEELVAKVPVGPLRIENWHKMFASLTGGHYVRIFDALYSHFNGNAAGFRLLWSIVAKDRDPLTTLERIYRDLHRYDELADKHTHRSASDRAPRYEPWPYAARLWMRRNADLGKIMLLLCRIPILGMRVTKLGNLLEREVPAIEADLAVLENEALIYRVEFSEQILWAPMNFLRNAFERMEMTRSEMLELSQYRAKYAAHCDSPTSNDIIGKLDSIFVSASQAFESGTVHAIEEAIARCVDNLQELIRAQRVGADAWIPVMEAIAKRASACDQVISVSQALSHLDAHALVGEIAWRMSHIDDYWAASAAIYAAMRHCCRADCDHDLWIERIETRLLELFRTTSSKLQLEPLADMQPAILLGSLCLLGHRSAAERLLSIQPYFRRQTVFSHLVPILDAAQRGQLADLQRLIREHWPKVRGGDIKKAAADYLTGICSACSGLASGGEGLESEYDFRRTSMQLAFSRKGLDFIDSIVLYRPRRFREEKIDHNILGATYWLPMY